MAQRRLQIPSGMQDTLPGECARKRQLEGRLRRLFTLQGYQEIETPILEFYDALDDRTFGHFLWNGKKYRIKEIAELSTPTTAQTLAVYADRFYATQPCFTVNELGKGCCYYIAARTDADFLNDALMYMLDEAGLKPILPKLPEGTWATERYQEDGTRFVFIQNATHEKKTIALPKAMKDAASGKTIYEQLEMGELSVAVLTDE